MMKSVVHTGKKIQFGGLNVGLFKAVYHVPIDGVVTSDPKYPTNNGMVIERISFVKFILYYFIFNK